MAHSFIHSFIYMCSVGICQMSIHPWGTVGNKLCKALLSWRCYTIMISLSLSPSLLLNLWIFLPFPSTYKALSVSPQWRSQSLVFRTSFYKRKTVHQDLTEQWRNAVLDAAVSCLYPWLASISFWIFLLLTQLVSFSVQFMAVFLENSESGIWLLRNGCYHLRI